MIRRYLLPAASVCLSALMTVNSTASEDRQARLNDGYYLLHSLSGDESQLPLLLDLKHAPPELGTYADSISKLGKETSATLENFQDKNSSINFDRNPLPQIEQDVRDSIKSDKQHQLLFGTSNSEFVRALLVAQIEATTYATHLCKVLADQETNPGRAEKLRHLSTKWLNLREEAFRMLRDY
jgi:hypothetical protein